MRLVAPVQGWNEWVDGLGTRPAASIGQGRPVRVFDPLMTGKGGWIRLFRLCQLGMANTNSVPPRAVYFASSR
jgi:hypothetical protein